MNIILDESLIIIPGGPLIHDLKLNGAVLKIELLSLIKYLI